MERPELRVQIVGEFEWVYVAILRWGDKTTAYRNDYFRVACGTDFYFGSITWGEVLQTDFVEGNINCTIPAELEHQSGVVELILLVECVKLLHHRVNVKFCFTYHNAQKLFCSGISEILWLRDYLKLFFWSSMFDKFEVSSIHVSRCSNKQTGHFGGDS